MNREHPDVQAGFRKAEEPEMKLPAFIGSHKKGLNDPDNHDDVVTLLEPDIWSVKSGGP